MGELNFNLGPQGGGWCETGSNAIFIGAGGLLYFDRGMVDREIFLEKFHGPLGVLRLSSLSIQTVLGGIEIGL